MTMSNAPRVKGKGSGVPNTRNSDVSKYPTNPKGGWWAPLKLIHA